MEPDDYKAQFEVKYSGWIQTMQEDMQRRIEEEAYEMLLGIEKCDVVETKKTVVEKTDEFSFIIFDKS